MNRELERLKTFESFFNADTSSFFNPKELAQLGFYYTNYEENKNQ